MRVTASAWVNASAEVRVEAPCMAASSIDGKPVPVPWIVDLDHQVLLHVADREALTKVRDAITAALDANPDAS